MKFNYIAVACAIILSTSGCGTAAKHGPRQSTSREQGMSGSGEKRTPVRTETVAYWWPDYGIEVAFRRTPQSARWIMTVRDSHAVIEQVLAEGNEKIWSAQDSKCSLKECLAIMDQGLRVFHAEKPHARLESFEIEMHLVKELWDEILVGVRERLSTMRGEKVGDAFEVPTEIGDAVVNVVRKSAAASAIDKLMRKHGLNTGTIGASQYIFFKDALSGKKWSDIATLPGLGILAPGTIEFDLGESRIGSASKRRANQ